MLVRDTALVKDERVLGLSGIGEGGAFIDVMGRRFAFQPPPRHTRMRALVSRAFTPRSVEKLRPRVHNPQLHLHGLATLPVAW